MDIMTPFDMEPVSASTEIFMRPTVIFKYIRLITSSRGVKRRILNPETRVFGKVEDTAVEGMSGRGKQRPMAPRNGYFRIMR